ncbi:MAG: hypothetical protein NZ930_02260 [Candidatus Bipolaricaulota bacterium]|nr:hypothetical protein [Candidatus Bipolaricaulota bacterium]MDW8030889.1 hypothetical protein [Candidatus Bipolaricaulota bacterium]
MNRTTILALVLVLCAGLMAAAQEPTGANPVFKNGVDARALAMGGAFVGVADGYSSCYWNPAGVAKAAADQSIKVGGMNTNLFGAGINYSFAGATWTLFGLPWGLSLSLVSITDIPMPDGTMGSDTELLGAFCGAFPVPLNGLSLVVGAAGKYYSQTLLDESATGLGFDAGLLVDGLIPGLTVGAAAYDIGGTRVTWSTGATGIVDQLFRVGFGLALSPDFTLAAGVDLYAGGELALRAGAEFRGIGPLAVRAGVVRPAGSEQFALTVGAGLVLGNLGVDFAWLQNNVIVGEGASDTIVLSASFRFGGAEEEAPPAQ